MTDRIQAIRGMNDILPEQTHLWRHIERTFAQCANHYAYQEIRTPLLESTQLFRRTIGDATDIVEKEMYSFQDLNGEHISLRPEGTAGCVRACLEHGLLHNTSQKLWYIGPMFRHEKPQKGRYRQFIQLGAEAFGFSGPLVELELIAMCKRYFESLGIFDVLKLQINSIGALNERKAYYDALIEYFTPHIDRLDEDSKRRLNRNPLRILDSKNPDLRDLIQNAPKLLDVLGQESKAHFSQLCEGLEALGICYEINPTLVRGLDYYEHTVFEWVTDQLGSQATVCAGGRFDRLIDQLGGKPVPAVGFAMGLERLILLRQTCRVATEEDQTPDIYIVAGDAQRQHALVMAEAVRANFPNSMVMTSLSGGGFKGQFKRADKSQAKIALILGEDEVKQKVVGVKHLRAVSEQQVIPQNELMAYLAQYLPNKINEGE